MNSFALTTLSTQLLNINQIYGLKAPSKYIKGQMLNASSNLCIYAKNKLRSTAKIRTHDFRHVKARILRSTNFCNRKVKSILKQFVYFAKCNKSCIVLFSKENFTWGKWQNGVKKLQFWYSNKWLSRTIGKFPTTNSYL